MLPSRPPGMPKSSRRPEHDEGMKFYIQMKPQSRPLKSYPAGMRDAISNDYARQYLTKIGVSPSRENMSLFLREMPLRKCHVLATWRQRGFLKDQFIIKPDGKLRPEDDNIIHEAKFNPSSSEDKVRRKSGTEEVKMNARGDGVVEHDFPAATVDRIVKKMDKVLEQDTKDKQNTPNNQYLNSMTKKHVYPFNKAFKSSIEDHEVLAGKEAMASLEESSRNVGEKTLAEAQRRSSDAYREILQPLEVTSDSLQEIHEDFVRIFPFHQFRSKLPKPKKKALEGTLTSPEMIRFSGLLSHYLYWNIARKEVADDVQLSDEINLTADPGSPNEQTAISGLNNEERERLFLDMMRAYNQIQITMRALPISFNFAFSCILLSLRTAVDRVFCTAYRWFRMRGHHEDKAVEMLTAMQQEVTRLFDPNLYGTHIAELGSSRVAMQLAQKAKVSSSTVLNSVYMTSAATRTLFPRPTSVGARRIMRTPGKLSKLQSPDDSSNASSHSSAEEVQSIIFKKRSAQKREALDTEKQTKLYASVLAKLRQQYFSAFSKTDDKHLLEREVMLEPISTKMINHHSLDLKRFQQEKFEEHLYSIANHLRHPDGWNTSPSRISTPPPNRRRINTPLGTPPTDPASINRYAGLKVKRDKEHRDISDNSGSGRKPGSPWTDLRSQGRMK